MKKNMLYSVMMLFLIFSCSKAEEGTQLPYDYSQQEEVDLKQILEEANWQQKELAEGIVWKYAAFPQLFDAKESVTLFEIDLDKGVQIEIPYVTSGFLKSSEAAEKKDALIAFNGSFFNTTVGGSTVFFKYDGQVVNQTVNGFTPYRENGAVVFNSTGEPAVVGKPDAGWSALTQPVALAGGPLLILEGAQLEQLEVSFNQDRHPRTAVGITADNTMIVAVIDGRSTQSAGMSIPELSDLMFALGCTQAVNLDGGGSSTAWVKGEGVVNYPSDNSKFDHEGERAVATVFTVKKK